MSDWVEYTDVENRKRIIKKAEIIEIREVLPSDGRDEGVQSFIEHRVQMNSAYSLTHIDNLRHQIW